MTDFLIATNNQHKIQEFKRILLPLGINVISAKDAGIDLGDVEENGSTFKENSKIKAISSYRKSGMPSIADDSGLCVDYLDGAPGVYTARYGGENLTQEQRNALLLKNLESAQNRTAKFVCSICCVFSETDCVEVHGECIGSIAHTPSGNGGFGYDPIFEYNGKSVADMSDAEKDAISHRGTALRALKTELSKRKDVL